MAYFYKRPQNPQNFQRPFWTWKRHFIHAWKQRNSDKTKHWKIIAQSGHGRVEASGAGHWVN